MRQIGLFDAGTTAGLKRQSSLSDAGDTRTIQAGFRNVVFYPDFNNWWSSASQCLQENVSPSKVWWTENRNAARAPRKSLAMKESAGFIQEATAASCHRSEDRWALLYSILWRLTHDEPQLLELSGDPQVAKLHQYAKAVARDVHKMKAFVRFRKVEGESPGCVPRYISWFEPQHFIVEYAAPFFKRRFSNMHWSILTPVGCAHWEGEGDLWFSDSVDKDVAPDGDQFEDAWRVYYKSIFNPARLKINAMQSEMPKKYWKNLPEAKEITALVASAEVSTQRMIKQRKVADNFHCGARPAHPDQIVHQQIQATDGSSLQALRLQASLCSGCPQSVAATQTVFGEGPDNARLMIIGEQPGDEEDLHGKPFIGPAGKVLDAALKHAGIDRRQCYLTNAVKHFGFEPRGKRRLHKRPDASVVRACAQWLQQELSCVNPEVVVYLGATAASTCFGPQVRVSRDRGKLIYKDARQHLITTHPSSILRLNRGAVQQNAYLQFINDLKLCASTVGLENKEHLMLNRHSAI